MRFCSYAHTYFNAGCSCTHHWTRNIHVYTHAQCSRKGGSWKRGPFKHMHLLPCFLWWQQHYKRSAVQWSPFHATWTRPQLGLSLNGKFLPLDGDTRAKDRWTWLHGTHCINTREHRSKLMCKGTVKTRCSCNIMGVGWGWIILLLLLYYYTSTK